MTPSFFSYRPKARDSRWGALMSRLETICTPASESARSGSWPGMVDHSSMILARGLVICAPMANALTEAGVP